MMIIRQQGIAFCAISFLVLGINYVVPVPDDALSRLVMLTFIVLLGIPHGALDTILGKVLFNMKNVRQWFGFLAGYLALSVSVVAVWWFFPQVFLVTFLIISAVHFATDPEGDFSKVYRISYGASILILPALRHEDVLRELFTYVAGQEAAQTVVSFMDAIVVYWLAFVVFLALLNVRKNVYSSIEFMFVILIGVILLPLLSFTIFFCVMHSARHTIRAFEFAKIKLDARSLLFMVIPTLAAGAVFCLAFMYGGNHNIDKYFLQLLFVMLAALTVPHMLLVEMLQYGWNGGRDRAGTERPNDTA